MGKFRVGMGYDVHKLQPNLPFILGGVLLDSKKGIVAHSDGDILIHAIADALLGAAGLGDIGHFFPDTDPKNKDIDSSIILSKVLKEITNLSFQIENIDVTIVLEKPKLQSYIKPIKQSLSTMLGIDLNQVNIKATTSERMGFVGLEQGVACYSVVLISKN